MRSTRKPKRSYRRLKWLAFFLFLLVLVLGVLKFGGLTPHGAEDGEAIGENAVHVMILGVDERGGDVGRSDTLMVATVDTETGRGAILSVPRDTRLAIEGHGYDKANHAYAFGGHELSMHTVEGLLGVKMDHYIIVNVKAFERIIDALGGVDIDVEKRMHYEDPWDDSTGDPRGLVIDLYPGEQHMDGAKAIQYVRYRDGEGDIGRIGRQQKFVRAVLEKVISPDILPRLPDLVQAVASAVKTDMSVTELLDFAGRLKDIHDAGLAADMVPGTPAYYKDVSYWLPDIVATRQLLAEEIGVDFTDAMQKNAETAAEKYKDDLPKELKTAGKEQKKADDATNDGESAKPMQPEEITVMVINSSGINGAGAEVADILKHKGFKISSVETGETSQKEKTSITTSSRNVDVFYGMPFPCVIMDGGSSNQAVVNIGRDYKK